MDVVFVHMRRRIPDEDAQKLEQLVPIRLEFDAEHHKMRDTFVWNLKGKSTERAYVQHTLTTFCLDPIITSQIFAQSGRRLLTHP